MVLKFSSNLSTMYQHVDLVDRFELAIKDGFDTFELQFPYTVEPSVLKDKKKTMKCDLINLYCGDTEYGCASHPLKEMEFCNSTERTMEYYQYLQFRKLHVMCGNVTDKLNPEEQLNQLVNTLRSMEDYLDTINVTALIEPICSQVLPNYFLNSFERAVDVLRALESDQFKLLLDVYHLHNITGDVRKYLDEYYPYAGHIQVSQEPGRTAPFTAGGKIDYKYVFDYLEQRKHQDYIGLEYFHSGTAVDWIKEYAQ